MATLAPHRVKTDGKIISITVFNFHKYIEVNYYSYVILHDLLVWSIRLFGLLCSPRFDSFDQKYDLLFKKTSLNHNVENICAFLWKFLGFFDEKKKKNLHLFEMESICNIINVFTVTFG